MTLPGVRSPSQRGRDDKPDTLTRCDLCGGEDDLVYADLGRNRAMSVTGRPRRRVRTEEEADAAILDPDAWHDTFAKRCVQCCEEVMMSDNPLWTNARCKDGWRCGNCDFYLGGFGGEDPGLHETEADCIGAWREATYHQSALADDLRDEVELLKQRAETTLEATTIIHDAVVERLKDEIRVSVHGCGAAMACPACVTPDVRLQFDNLLDDVLTLAADAVADGDSLYKSGTRRRLRDAILDRK